MILYRFQDGIYTLTLDCDPGGFEWKYLAGGAWGTEEQFDGSESCTMRTVTH